MPDWLSGCATPCGYMHVSRLGLPAHMTFAVRPPPPPRLLFRWRFLPEAIKERGAQWPGAVRAHA